MHWERYKQKKLSINTNIYYIILESVAKHNQSLFIIIHIDWYLQFTYWLVSIYILIWDKKIIIWRYKLPSLWLGNQVFNKKTDFFYYISLILIGYDRYDNGDIFFDLINK